MSRYNNAAELASELTTSQQEVADLRWPTAPLTSANDECQPQLRSSFWLLARVSYRLCRITQEILLHHI